jgi:hypothetical protein
MAAMDTILTGLTTEIRKAISQIDPNHLASFKFRSPKNLQTQPLEGQTGVERLFEVLWDLPKQMDGGHTEKTWDVPGSVKIGYPIQSEWNIAKASDIQQIFDTLNQTDSSVTGCNFRHVPQEEDPEQEDAEDDWTWMTIPLRAVVTTT